MMKSYTKYLDIYVKYKNYTRMCIYWCPEQILKCAIKKSKNPTKTEFLCHNIILIHTTIQNKI